MARGSRRSRPAYRTWCASTWRRRSACPSVRSTSTCRVCASAIRMPEAHRGLPDKMPNQPPLLMLDGPQLKDMVQASLAWLRVNQQAINALNVFPVPDGDTGTNMLLPLQAAWAEVEKLSGATIHRIAHATAHGALMGARGNSGVILSQLWRGFARGLDNHATMNAGDFAIAMREGCTTAYKGVIKPVEGTILSVSRAAAGD